VDSLGLTYQDLLQRKHVPWEEVGAYSCNRDRLVLVDRDEHWILISLDIHCHPSNWWPREKQEELLMVSEKNLQKAGARKCSDWTLPGK
jgi:hypothetical protein